MPASDEDENAENKNEKFNFSVVFLQGGGNVRVSDDEELRVCACAVKSAAANLEEGFKLSSVRRRGYTNLRGYFGGPVEEPAGACVRVCVSMFVRARYHSDDVAGWAVKRCCGVGKQTEIANAE